MKNKALSFGKNVNKKNEENNQQSTKNSPTPPADNQVVNSNAISKIVSNKIDAMQKFNLKVVTKSGKYELEKNYYDSFGYLASRLDKTIQELASEYVFDRVKKELQKHNISVIENE